MDQNAEFKMEDLPNIRGMRPWDARGRVYTEFHSDPHLKGEPGGFNYIQVQHNEITSFYYFDNRNLQEAEEAAMELWLKIREIRKNDSLGQAIVMIKAK